ncbi:ATP-binding protein [Sphingopyxis sp. OPL5]|uniref:ATP-binding protein n=1 Tax=Sphingopyxis sp. OPL5 TaxID=2486273 RepID=UPI001656CB0A|nr:ATP-binding protein [Sphingopyxis sp. OPL5]QNO26378.1 ATP-binding protein [Sphingopyxis sp. OPL5]
MAKFAVDTKLFRELGELLVGRDSTAMVELVKNAYDADSRLVRVHGERLNDADGVITIQDDGTGMTVQAFEKGFLTIAGRTKTEGQHKSPLFKRRFTGEKGVGRLAAHKLASDLHITSHHWDGAPLDPVEGLRSDQGVAAHIDWDEIEKLETLDDIEGTNAVETKPLGAAKKAGTKLVLRRPRRSWGAREFDAFFRDVATLVPAEPIIETLPKSVVSSKLLFASPTIRDTSTGDPGFKIEYSGDFRDSASEVPAVSEAAYWVIEIDCDPARGNVKVAVEPTNAARRASKYENAEGWRGDYPIPKSDDAVQFTARIFEKDGTPWTRAYAGIRVYLEGFRIPPYGDPNDDWLELDSEYRSRGKGEQGRLRRFTGWEVPEGDEGEGLTIKGNAHYFGAVFLTREGSSKLQMLVNREGFLPGPRWNFVSDVVRWAVGVQVRQRRMASADIVQHRKVDAKRRRAIVARADEGSAPVAFHARELHQQAVSIVREMKTLTAAGNSRAAAEQLDRLEEVVVEADQISSDDVSEAVMFRVLASVGLEQAAFIHEILGLGATAEVVADGLDRIARQVPIGPEKRALRALAGDAKELRERLKRNGIYLSEMTGVEGRKRRSRLKLRDRFEPVAAFYQASAERRGVVIVNDIPSSLVSPPIFPAEAAALFSNLLSNAVKFAGTPGSVRAVGRATDDEVIICFENTGIAVDAKSADRWFEPFRSTTSEVDANLGQGMGLGLTVSRSLMDEYGGVIQFVKPSAGFKTAIELRWPRR